MYVENDIIKRNIDLINRYLNSIGFSDLEDSQYFVKDELSYSNHVKFVFNKFDHVRIEISFSLDGIMIGIDRIPEAFSWSNRDLNESEIVRTLQTIFKCRAKVIYCGANYTKVIFMNTNNKIEKSIRFINGLYLKILCREFIFAPIC